MSSASVWPLAPEGLSLSPREVQVWRVALEMDPAGLEVLQQTLAPEEKARAAQFHFPKDRRHFIAARGTLRDILARYLHRDPARLQFCYGPEGKPALAPGQAPDVRFNLSHSHGLALFAVTRIGEIGIDVERIDADVARERVAERFFSPQEVSALRALPAHLQPVAFFNCWTRKEAYVKARGDGLRLPLDSFDVSLVPGAPAAFLRGAEPQWSLQALIPAPDYVGAIAAEGHGWPVRLWQWHAARTAAAQRD